MTRIALLATMFAGLAAAGCARPDGGSLAGRSWQLVGLDEQASPPGAGGRPATLEFDTVATPASGFAGCNRYAGPYTRSGGGLTFGPLVSTRMACVDGDALERRFLAALAEVSTYTVSDSVLTLRTPGGSLLRFVPR